MMHSYAYVCTSSSGICAYDARICIAAAIYGPERARGGPIPPSGAKGSKTGPFGDASPQRGPKQARSGDRPSLGAREEGALPLALPLSRASVNMHTFMHSPRIYAYLVIPGTRRSQSQARAVPVVELPGPGGPYHAGMTEKAVPVRRAGRKVPESGIDGLRTGRKGRKKGENRPKTGPREREWRN